MKKKMTKEEAHEYLKNSKIYVDGKSVQIQQKLSEAGFKRVCGDTISEHVGLKDMPFLYVYGSMISDDHFTAGTSMAHFSLSSLKELKADDILSIEIEENPEDKIVELAKPLMEYLQDQNFTDAIRVNAEGIYLEPMSSILYEI